jgi:hypothetical protein
MKNAEAAMEQVNYKGIGFDSFFNHQKAIDELNFNGFVCQ